MANSAEGGFLGPWHDACNQEMVDLQGMFKSLRRGLKRVDEKTFRGPVKRVPIVDSGRQFGVPIRVTYTHDPMNGAVIEAYRAIAVTPRHAEVALGRIVCIRSAAESKKSAIALPLDVYLGDSVDKTRIESLEEVFGLTGPASLIAVFENYASIPFSQ